MEKAERSREETERLSERVKDEESRDREVE